MKRTKLLKSLTVAVNNNAARCVDEPVWVKYY